MYDLYDEAGKMESGIEHLEQKHEENKENMI